jgi:acyl-CoA synthetase (AMP-forming)/AMP-acid ligase II
MSDAEVNIHLLDTGASVTSLSPHASPFEEYQAAFTDRDQAFFEYYSLHGKSIETQVLTRGEFWDLACEGAAYLSTQGVSKGDRVLHCFSGNSLHDAVFRLSSVLLGCAPVTVNWQVDDNDRIADKAKMTGARYFLYDAEFAGRVEAIRSSSPAKVALKAENVSAPGKVRFSAQPSVGYEDEKIVIFTSGTTGEPKGVSLPYRSYLANKLTFEHYFDITEDTEVDILLVNPLHHTNSTAFLDWAMRRPGTRLYLAQRYSTLYWKILAELVDRKRDLFIAPGVSRHIDFLAELSARSELPVAEDRIKAALARTDMLIGSAPVGPTTVNRVMEFSRHLPMVRFGSTETCLQVMATPRTLSPGELMRAFEAGWSHSYLGEDMVGYYIGRDHFPFTQVRAVKAIDPEHESYLVPCDIGEPGYLITRGPNIMSHYVGDIQATRNAADGQLDYYWMTRDSALLIRGGANYAYDQVGAELARALMEDFALRAEQFKLAVIGLRVGSEHEDSCCVTIELTGEVADKQPCLETSFIDRARHKVPKGFWPDYLRFAVIPTNFKGLVLVPELRRDFRQYLEAKGLTVR